MDSVGFVLRGRFVHAVGAPGELEFIEDGCVVVGEDGAISHVAKTTEAVEVQLNRTDLRVLTCADTYALTTHYPLPTAYCLLPTTYYLLPTTCYTWAASLWASSSTRWWWTRAQARMDSVLAAYELRTGRLLGLLWPATWATVAGA